MNMRDIAICGGGDWFDASVDMIRLPEHVDIEQANKEYRKWLKEVYWPRGNQKIKFVTFVQWLRDEYDAEDSDIEEYFEI